MQILADHINKRTTHGVTDVEWSVIFDLARSHQVGAIVYVQCKKVMPIEIQYSFRDVTYKTQICYSNRKALLNDVSSALKEEGVSFFEVKGLTVAQYYPMPALRTMGDNDLIVHGVDMARTINILRKMGFQGVDNDRAHDWECYKNNYMFEIHDWLVQNVEHTNELQRDFFNQFDPYFDGEKLDWSFHFLFLLMHLRKHFMNSGVGIRQFMDLAIIIEYCMELDWMWIEQKLVLLELNRFAAACFSLIEKWFGIIAPISFNHLENEFVNEVTEKILKNGVFGKDNENNRGNYERNLIIKSHGNTLLSRAFMIIHVFFPPYKSMCSYPGCGYINGRPFLLPIAWIHRGIMYFRKGNTEKFWRVFETGVTEREKLEDQRIFLEKMGL